MGIQFPPIAFLYLLYFYLFIYLFSQLVSWLLFSCILLLYSWYKVSLNLNFNLKVLKITIGGLASLAWY